MTVSLVATLHAHAVLVKVASVVAVWLFFFGDALHHVRWDRGEGDGHVAGWHGDGVGVGGSSDDGSHAAECVVPHVRVSGAVGGDELAGWVHAMEGVAALVVEFINHLLIAATVLCGILL